MSEKKTILIVAKLAKRIRFIATCFLLLLAIGAADSQIDTTLRDYFPMHTGDLWEYEMDEYPTYPRFQVRNVGDTLMPNGRIYSHFEGLSPGLNPAGFYRMDDSLRVYEYQDFPHYPECQDSEFVVYDLSVSDRGLQCTCLPSFGDSLATYIGLVWTHQMVPYPRLGVFADTKMFCEAQIDSISGDTNFCPLVPRINYIPRRLAKGFGLVWEQFEGPALNLDGAIINGVQYGRITEVGNYDLLLPTEFFLRQNYPNPFNPSTTIRYQLPQKAFVTLKVYTILGQELAILVDEEKEAGFYQVQFDGAGLASGVYFYRMRAGEIVETKKLLLLR